RFFLDVIASEVKRIEFDDVHARHENIPPARSISMRPPPDQDIRRPHPWLTDPPEALGSKQDLPHRSRHPPQLQLPLAGHLANLTSKRHKRQQATQREPPVFPLFETLVSLVSLKREKEYKIEREDGGWSAKRLLQKFCGNLPRKCVTSDTAVSLFVFQPLNLQKTVSLVFSRSDTPFLSSSFGLPLLGLLQPLGERLVTPNGAGKAFQPVGSAFGKGRERPPTPALRAPGRAFSLAEVSSEGGVALVPEPRRGYARRVVEPLALLGELVIAYLAVGIFPGDFHDVLVRHRAAGVARVSTWKDGGLQELQPPLIERVEALFLLLGECWGANDVIARMPVT